MKNICKLLFAALLLGGATSCTDFLEADPKGLLATKNFFKNQNDLEMSLNALYAQVAGSQIYSNPTIPQVQGDDITSTTGSNKSAYLSADAFEEPSDYKGVNDLWLFTYRVIQASNLIIDNAERADASQEYINMALGNAYFWRAVSYFQLVRVFGPLPVNLHNEPDGNNTPLTSVDKIYDEIIVPDLLKAESLGMPTSYDKWKLGHAGNCDYWITEQAVKSALTAVYMAMAGYPLQRGNEYYKMAADKAKEVIDGVEANKYHLSLEPEWKQVYSIANNWSAEQIVTISYRDVPGVNTGPQYTLVYRFGNLNGGWGDFIPERLWWHKYPAGPRKNAVYDPQILTSAKAEDGNFILVDWWADKQDKSGNIAPVFPIIHPMFSLTSVNADESGQPIVAPYDYTKRPYLPMTYPQNHRIIRYSEVLCWFAESAARSGVYTKEAQDALHKVVSRAYNSDNMVNVYSLTGEDLALQAFLEHSYEVTGYTLALVTRRADQFRLGETASGIWADQTLKATYDYRAGNQDLILVPKGTVTHGYKESGNKFGLVNTPWEYELQEDLILKEQQPMAKEWRGIYSMYHPYPPTEVEKNPNLVR